MVWLDFEHAESQRAARLRYRNILEKTFQRPVVYVHNRRTGAEIRLIDRKLTDVDHNWIVSHYLIDEIPGFSLISRQEYEKQERPAIGVIRRPYLYPYQGVRYSIDNMNVAHTMLKNKRIDYILDYTRESGYYTQLNPKLVVEQLSQSRAIRVLLSNQENAQHFNRAMNNLAGIKRYSDQPDNNGLSQNSNEFRWLMVARQLDHGSNELTATDVDVKITLWLESQLVDYRIKTELSNPDHAFKVLRQNSNICIVNTEKAVAEQTFAVFSAPTHVFLDKRLYSHQYSKANSLAHTWFIKNESGLFDLSTFAQENPTTIFGYFEQSAGADTIAWAFRDVINAYPHRFIKIKNEAIDRSINLLRKSRIDFLIAQPLEMQQIKLQFESVPPLSSYPVRYFENPIPLHIACSNDDNGGTLIARINQLLLDQSSRTQLKTLIAEEMLPDDQAAFVEAFDEAYLQLLSKN